MNSQMSKSTTPQVGVESSPSAYREPLSVTVKHVGRRYVISLFSNGELHSSSACELKSDIGYMVRDLMRWYDKCGGKSRWARSARLRHNADYSRGRRGRVWFYTHLYPTKDHPSR